MSYLLDTNVLAETRKRSCNLGVTEWISATPPERLYLSVLTVGEIGRGVARLADRGDQRQATVIEGWLDDVVQEFGDRVLAITLLVVREWGQQHTVPTVGGLIAATAKVHGLTVVSRNTKDFEDTGARLVNPFRE